ncbi:MAG: hypothetical protein KBE09_03450 [Candidatus Pacebacteria bacterium]|nr:hypothetical protein [Candidatus Paceibacterota bacterium]
MRFRVISRLWALIRGTDQPWLLPIILLLVIAGLVIVAAAVSPVPLFLYPII